MVLRRVLLSSSLATVLVLTLAGAAVAKVESRVVDYEIGGAALQGFLAWDDAATGKHAGVLVSHEWWGHNEHARRQAQRLAEAGYVAFALDMFGKGKVTTHPADAKELVAEVNRDPATARARFDAALALLRADPHVDAAHVAVVGYCFGGTTALNMALAGADVSAVVAIHAGLQLTAPEPPVPVRARVLILTGGADPMAPPERVQAAEKQLTAAGASVKVVTFPNAKHGFTNVDADKAGVPSLGYDADADQKSFAEMQAFLKQTLGS
jgi:dienelactone hydrolase